MAARRARCKELPWRESVEDLIFAGTQKRARVGMAQASLYFENKNKFFPVDFEEWWCHARSRVTGRANII